MQQHYMHHFTSQHMMVKCCPVHGEGHQYKQTLDMMQAQAHAYAFNTFMYFQQMSKQTKLNEEKAFYN